MKFLKLSNKERRVNLNNCSYPELIEFTKYIADLGSSEINLKNIHSTTKIYLIENLNTILSTTNLIDKIYGKLSKSEASKFIYENLIWEVDSLKTIDVTKKFKIDLLKKDSNNHGYFITKQDNNLLFVQREEGDYYSGQSDILRLRGNFKPLLRMFYPVPETFEIVAVADKEVLSTAFTYSNEDGIFNFISVISDMLKNNLVEFGQTNEKPLTKTLNILKSSTGINEFYADKKLSLFATDMFTRSFSYYYWSIKGYKTKEIDVLRNFLISQFEDKLGFFITRIFLGHLKKVRYDSWYTRQLDLFDTLKSIISRLPQDGWVDMQNIISSCRYQNLRIDLDSAYKTATYCIECDVLINNKVAVTVDTFYCERRYYDMLFYEPILKASFFYLGALGIFELKYDEPRSSCNISAKAKPYISVWDSLKYVRLSELGKYIFGFKDSYEQKDIVKKTTTIKFDEYKPIITVDKTDTIMQAKLDAYCDKYDEGRYILSYSKIFKDCKNTKVLDAKIDGFYKNIEKNPPKVFKDFFDDIKKDANMLKRDLKQVVIELNNNKKLLNLFMTNKKLQELVIKAQGYRVIVLKENIPKLTKIVKDNGFFVEF